MGRVRAEQGREHDVQKGGEQAKWQNRVEAMAKGLNRVAEQGMAT